MASQHENIVKTISDYLRTKQDETRPRARDGPGTDEEAEESIPSALVIAGFHTGRSTVARFFEIATGSAHSPSSTATNMHKPGADTNTVNVGESHELRAAELFEIDVDCKVRPWLPDREGESKDAAKRWCAVGVLVRR